MTITQQQQSLSAFNEWLENDKKVSLTGPALKAHALFEVKTSGDSSVSGQNTIATGNDAAKQAAVGQDLDKAIKDQNKNEIVDILARNPGNAVTSILGLAQSRTDWNPLDPDNAKNSKGFTDFVASILKVPFFTTTQSETKTVHYEEENYNSLIDKVVDLYDGVTDQNKEKIKLSISNLIKACTSRVNTQNTDTLFVQNTLQAANGNIVVQLQQTYMYMELDHNTGKGAPKDKYKTQIDVKVLELTFSSALWTRDAAEKLADKFVQSWDDWLNGTTTPDSAKQSRLKFCFGNGAAAA
ncbi:hypothetical protein [Dryocola sp. BD626]|uniref:hypothetical protein n=1 Tax=Dryocola sp. BD626 TaxID=3133273 RepID=UPI003F4FC5D1